MKQKFLRGHKVKIADEMPSWMSHFRSGCEAIVVGSYRDQFGGGKRDAQQYELALLDKKGKVYDTSAWYEEYQLTLVDTDRDKGEDLLQEWENRDDCD